MRNTGIVEKLRHCGLPGGGKLNEEVECEGQTTLV
jgi:hypothetical protein